jgi:hypothetical protein
MRTRNLLALLLMLVIASATFGQSAKVKGKVMDTSGSIMPGVQVKLYQSDKVVTQAKTTDMGEFEFPANPGDYKLEVTAPDFNTFNQTVKVTPDMAALTVTMELATISQNVDVTETRNEISIDSDSSLQTTVLKQDFIDALPDDEDELTAYLSQIAGARGDAGGGATFVIDGFTGGRVPPKDQIQEIRISNNPFSSEFSGVGYGRTEIITKAGTGDYHGSANFDFRDNTLNARQPFLTNSDGTPAVKPQAQTRNIQSNFSGPIIRNKLSLNLNVRSFYNQNANTIRATVAGADGSAQPYSASIISPNTNRNINARTQFAINKNNTLYVNFQNQHQQRLNQLGGGVTTLPDRAADNTVRNSEFQMRETAILTKSIVHEVRFEYRTDYSNTNPHVVGQAVNVLDSFNSGGGQNSSLTNYKSVEFSNLLMYSGPKWTVKGGFQALNHMNHSVVQNNFLGTYTFSSLALYVQNKPLQYTQTSGNPLLDVNQLELGTFVQTDWKVTKKLNLMMGGRYEAQTNINYHKGFDPRLAFALELSKTMALRGGLGIFHQREDESIVESMLRLNGTNQTSIVITNPSYQPGCEIGATCNPLLGGNGIILPSPPPTIRVTAPNLVTPFTENWSLSLEKTLPGGLGLTFSWDHQRGEHLYRSRDINAPLPGLGIPDPTKGIVYQLEASGLSKSNNYTLSFREQMRNRFNVQVFGNYTLGFQNNDTDGWQSVPVNSYDMRSEWGRSGNDYRHRLFTGTSVRLPWAMTLVTQVNWSSSNPYTITTGQDNNGDQVINDRPTDTALCQFLAGRPFPGQSCAAPTGTIIARNTGIGAGLFNVQMNLQKTIQLKHGEKSGPAKAGNNTTGRGSNFVPPQGGGGGGGFQGGGGNFPGGGGGGGNFPGGGQGGNFPGGGQRGGNNNGGFNNNQSTGGPTMVIRLNAQNLLNNVQYNGYVGTMTSSFFGAANSARNPRTIEAQVRVNF